jgi:hypothetical protein
MSARFLLGDVRFGKEGQRQKERLSERQKSLRTNTLVLIQRFTLRE